MRVKFMTIGMVCGIIRMMLMPFLFLGTVLEWWVLSGICVAVGIGTMIYQIVKVRCPYCGRCLAFVRKHWNGHCPGCGCEIK